MLLWDNHYSITTLIACMYGIFTYNYDNNQPNVGNYTIHDGMGYDGKIMKLVPTIKITNRKSKFLKLFNLQHPEDPCRVLSINLNL